MEAYASLRFIQRNPTLHLLPSPTHQTQSPQMRKHSRVLAVLTSPPAKDFTGRVSDDLKMKKSPADEEVVRTVYHDNWFDRWAIHHLSTSIQVTAGIKSKGSGYENLVETASLLYKNFNSVKQRELVLSSLDRAFPKPILDFIRMLMPQSKFAREYYAAFTTIFFAWLVGNCEVKESEVNGRKEKNVVHIHKCRLLEESNCVGVCLNLCKVPCQTFIKDSLGMPVNMIPNFEDMSCQMVYGEEPLAPADDPAFNQPCFKLCKSKQRHTTNCTTTQ